MNPSQLDTVDDNADALLSSRAIIVLTGLSYLCVGLAFLYLDRGYKRFPAESLMWLVWTVTGFGAGALYLRGDDQTGQIHWMIQGGLGFLFALFPCFLMFNLLRWTALTLLIVLGARAAIMRTRRDFYLSLTVIPVVSMVVLTHGNADWTLWFYLGPAWLLASLALTWEHASSTKISVWVKVAMTTAFIGLSVFLAALLFLWAPRPPVFNFGFLPLDTGSPTQYSSEGGGHGMEDGNTPSAGQSKQGRNGGSPDEGSVQTWPQRLQTMRRDLADSNIPGWQSRTMFRALDWGEALSALMKGELILAQSFVVVEKIKISISLLDLLTGLLVLILAMFLRYWVWPRRYRWGVVGVLLGARLLANAQPMASMRCSALALKWCLQQRNHPRSVGQSVREHLESAPALPALARRWLGTAVDWYCETRFGSVPATPVRADNMQQAVRGATHIIEGIIPELQRD